MLDVTSHEFHEPLQPPIHCLLEFPSTGKSVTIQCLQTFIAETGGDKVIKLQCFSPSVCVCQLFVCACVCQSLSVCYVYVNHDVISVCVGVHVPVHHIYRDQKTMPGGIRYLSALLPYDRISH